MRHLQIELDSAAAEKLKALGKSEEALETRLLANLSRTEDLTKAMLGAATTKEARKIAKETCDQ